RKIFLGWLHKYLIGLSVNDAGIDKALKKNMFPYKFPRLFYLQQVMHNMPQKTSKLRKRIHRRLSHIMNRSAQKND
ncbi:MAG: hypothetical protein M3512_15380, partial [Bacteroidota bacterium]|nr:hypothetical protein [Bacteroidota bacterium]